MSSGDSKGFGKYRAKLAALRKRARNVSGGGLVDAYLRGQTAASAGLACGWRNPGDWGELACNVCGGGGLLREAVRMYRDGGELVADFVRVSECVGCHGSGVDGERAMAAGDAGAEAWLSLVVSR